VAINKVKDRKRFFRRRTRLLSKVVRESEVETSPSIPPATSPNSLLDTRLGQAVRGLPTKQRTAIALYYLADLSVAEVAEAMSVSEATVKDGTRVSEI